MINEKAIKAYLRKKFRNVSQIKVKKPCPGYLYAAMQGGKKNVKIKQRNRGGGLYEYCCS